MKRKTLAQLGILVISSSVVLACIVNNDDPEATGCTPANLPEDPIICVTCTGGHCGPNYNQVTADVLGFRGEKTAVKDVDEDGLDTYQDTESTCQAEVSYVCDGEPVDEWIGPSDSGRSQIPAGADCYKSG